MKRWTLIPIIADDSENEVWGVYCYDEHIGTVSSDVEHPDRYGFVVGQKRSFKTYPTPTAAMNALRARLRQRKQMAKREEQADE